ncbi:hypothetical protein GCM10027403_07580 [Arthrobacter tecti]
MRCLAEAVERHPDLRPARQQATPPPASVFLHDSRFACPATAAAPLGLDGVSPVAQLESLDDVTSARCGVWVPADALTLYGPGWFPHGSVGLAAGADTADAVRAGGFELIERTNVAHAWRQRLRLHEVPLPGYLRVHVEQNVTARLFAVPGGVRAPVMMLALRNPERGLLGIGAACRSTWQAAARKAWEEAAVSLAQSAELADPDTAPEITEAAGLQPYRISRDYLGAYGPGLEAAVDHASTLQLYLDPAVQQGFLTWLDEAAPCDAISPDRAEPATCPDPIAALHTAGRPVYAGALHHPDAAAVGLSVARVLCPGLESPQPGALLNLGLPEGAATRFPVPLA